MDSMEALDHKLKEGSEAFNPAKGVQEVNISPNSSLPSSLASAHPG
mgnify:CR=1 FL=1